jgi:hypothetical protein
VTGDEQRGQPAASVMKVKAHARGR